MLKGFKSMVWFILFVTTVVLFGNFYSNVSRVPEAKEEIQASWLFQAPPLISGAAIYGFNTVKSWFTKDSDEMDLPESETPDVDDPEQEQIMKTQVEPSLEIESLESITPDTNLPQ